MSNKITKIIENILADFLKEKNLELYACDFKKEGADWNLSVYIERIPETEGITTDDCEQVSRYLSEKLDREDPIKQSYNLIVSSPGMDRELVKEEHYRRYIGREIDISLFKSFGGRKKYSGMMKEVDENNILLQDEDGDRLIPRSLVSKVRLSVIF